MSIVVRLYDENHRPYGIRQIDSKPRVSSTPFYADIAAGKVSGYNALNKFGHNNAVGSAYEDIWSGSVIYPFLASAIALEITASVASDDSGSEGAKTLWLNGLDRDWNELEETISLDGTTPVKTVNNFLRIHRAFVVTAGNSGSNVGALEIKASGGAVLALVEAQIGQTLMAIWTVPSGQTFKLIQWYASSAISKAIDIGIWVRDGDVSDAAWQNKQFANFTSDTFSRNLCLPLEFTQKTDIIVKAKAAAGGGDISAGFTGYYKPTL